MAGIIGRLWKKRHILDLLACLSIPAFISASLASQWIFSAPPEKSQGGFFQEVFFSETSGQGYMLILRNR